MTITRLLHGQSRESNGCDVFSDLVARECAHQLHALRHAIVVVAVLHAGTRAVEVVRGERHVPLAGDALGDVADVRALMQSGAWLLFVLSPFAVLEPLAYLSQTDEYARRFDWMYLALALAITILSHHRQRRSFYYAGLLNTGVALWFITSHNEWFDRPVWAVAVIATGLVVLFAGFGLDTSERTRRVSG